MRLMVTRPEPDASEQARKLGRMSIDVLVEPMMEIEFLDVEDLNETVGRAQALIVTSRNGLRALARSPAIGRALGTSVLAVGPASGRLAGELGFEQVHEGAGGAGDLLAVAGEICDPASGPMVHLAGEELAFDLKGELEARGFSVVQPMLYRASASPALSAVAKGALESGGLAGVVLMSPRTAKIYARQIVAEGLEGAIKPLMHFCLSPAVAEQISDLPGARYLVANRPREDDLLALIGKHAADCQIGAQTDSR
jgi:uroporphyrinogen-III synthase